MTCLDIYESFVSIQGEASLQGYPCFFIRLAGCNLRCRACDTPRARETGGRRLTLPAIVNACREAETPLIAITGGEPLAQPGFRNLAERLVELPARTVLVETNGSYDISVIPDSAITIMDIKCPGSGEAEAMDPANPERLRAHDEVKFVLHDRTDYLFALDTMRRLRLTKRCRHILFSPAAGTLDAKRLAQWLIADRPPVRLQLQWHRLLEVR